MPAIVDVIREALGAGGLPRAYCVAYSGGLDSTVLLHAMHALRAKVTGLDLRAIHVNHGLHPDAAHWARHCLETCARLDVPLRVVDIEVPETGGDSPEAVARRARYRALAACLDEGETLLTAHHRDDLVETVLLHLVRGSGVQGLASIPANRSFAAGRLARPLLSLGRDDIESAAREFGCDWIEDPSNADTSLDRNLLRHSVLPALRARWPAVARTIARSAALCAEASALNDDLAAMDAAGLVEGNSLAIEGLRRLAPPRRRNLLRYAIRQWGAQPPGEARLDAGLAQFLGAGADRQPELCWTGGRLRRYRDRLYFLNFDPEQPGWTETDWNGIDVLDMGPVRGRLQAVRDGSGGVPSGLLEQGLTIKFRRGGERLADPGGVHHKALKKLFQEAGILPWMRRHVPLIYAGDRLLAAGDLWIAGDIATPAPRDGVRFVWDAHAPLR